MQKVNYVYTFLVLKKGLGFLKWIRFMEFDFTLALEKME